MAKYIQLYLDADFILPIGVGESGDFQKYIDQQASRRLWLYFNKANNMYESSEANKANFEAGREGFYGDFWHHIGKDDVISGTSYKYIDLLDLSRIISKIREWSNVALLTESPEVVLNFSTVIPLKARKAFANYIQSKLGKVRSYSIEMNDLLASKIAHDHRSMSPSFGDQLFIIQSAGRDILLSVQTWCGGMFMQGDDCVRLEKMGNEYLKYALAKIVVDYYEQTYRRLTPDRKEQEYLYQMQFTEGWLKERKGGDTFWIDNFHYSNNPERTYTSFEVDGKQLDLIERDAIRTTINNISKFYHENIINRHLHTILIGDVFKEEVFLRDCVSVTSSDGKYTYFNDNATQEALGRYFVKYSTLEENIDDIERKYHDKSNERERIRIYVKNAETLGHLQTKLAEAIESMSEAVNEAKNRNADLLASWESFMKRSRFVQAMEVVDRMTTSDNLFVAKGKYVSIMREVEQCNSLLTELMQLEDVQDIVCGIRSAERQLRELFAEADMLANISKELGKKTQKYSDLYGRYQEVKRQFEAEPTLTVRRSLIEEMKELTMEDMPVLDVDPIRGTLVVTSKKAGGFMGFGAKRMVTITLNIEEPLPCKSVLIVSPALITSIPKGRYGIYCIDVDKGQHGEVINITEEITALHLDKDAKSLFVKFWPHEDEKVPISRFEVKGGTITI